MKHFPTMKYLDHKLKSIETPPNQVAHPRSDDLQRQYYQCQECGIIVFCFLNTVAMPSATAPEDIIILISAENGMGKRPRNLSCVDALIFDII